ncbi:alpha/beta hydrolase [Clostridium sp. P21]|uniref:Alpha/beta hydrolase n=1 Tax=Clostridium muellerianum TaxID=2716538 RepID=A0A7Y0HMR4_9CLOT|nr:alpha/beta hydrolase [Clostridium muellerianum]NMM61877.1 alpha/beta hydrolase [Clostridium muellerianum]
MRINTYGTETQHCVLLLHTMFTTGALFEKIISELQDYFLVVPTLDGYDPTNTTEYLGSDSELEQIETFLSERNIVELTAAGSSLGAMLVWKLWQRGNIRIRRLILDSPPFDVPSAAASVCANGFWQLVLGVQADPDAQCIFDEQYGEFGPMMRKSCLTLTENTIRQSCETCFGPQLPNYVQAGDTKILLIYGEQDPNYKANCRKLDHRKDISVVVKPGYRHCGFLMKEPLEFAKLFKEE